MIIPAFALGRAQEVILILKKAINSKKFKKVNIYIDGMVKDINRVYKFNPLYLKNTLGKKILRGIEPFYDDNIIQVENKYQRETLLDCKESCVIISSSGMLTGGPIQFYAEKIAALKVVLKCESIDEYIFFKIKEIFEHNTGCTLEL